LLACNVAAPQLFWFRGVRNNTLLLFVISLAINVGMWLERYVIVVTSLHRDFLPSSWGMYAGTRWDWATLLGSMGLFLSLLFVFLRVLPMISIYEMRSLVAEEERK
jgi:molybdopterin-containing oxidoreductase family membrane subunit